MVSLAKRLLNSTNQDEIVAAMAARDRFKHVDTSAKAIDPRGKSNAYRSGILQGLRMALSQGQAGHWVNDHRAETEQFKGWNYVAIHAICKAAMAASVEVFEDGEDRDTQKSLRKMLRLQHGARWKSFIGEDESVPVPVDHRLRKLLSRPSPTQSGAGMRYEMLQQLLLTGTIIIWKVPNRLGLTVERYVIPTAITTPIEPSQRFPKGGLQIHPRRVHNTYDDQGFVQIGGYSLAVNSILPMNDLIVIRLPHPLYKDDGLSPTGAGGEWIDSSAMVDRARHSQMLQGPNPSLLVSLPDDIDPTQAEIDAYEERLNNKFGGPDKNRRVFVGTHDKISEFGTSPKDMDYTGGFEQYRDAVMALHGVTKVAAGLVDGMTYGSIAAALKAFSELTVQPLLDLVADEETEQQSPEFGAGLTVEYDAPQFNDPELIEQQLSTDIAAGVRTKDEVRTLRGLDAWGGERGEQLAGQQDTGQPPATSAPGLDLSGLSGFAEQTEPTEPETQEESESDETSLANKILAKLSGFAKTSTLQKTPGPHKYSTVMAMLGAQDTEQVLALSRSILEEDLIEPETEPHVTIKYGLLTADPQDVLPLVRGVNPFSIQLGEIKAFPATEDRPSDVLFLEVFSEELERLNQLVCDSLPYADEKPYLPHLTLAYVKPGTAEKYLGRTDLTDQDLFVSRLVFSPHTGSRVVIPLNGVNNWDGNRKLHEAALYS